jgi:hypothetical protein
MILGQKGHLCYNQAMPTATSLIGEIIDAANKAIENASDVERWGDPGDYPSGAGGGPLASYDYIVAPESVTVVVPCTEEAADLLGETWRHQVCEDDVELDLSCKISKVLPVRDGQIAVQVCVEAR